ncbi:carbamoyl phosphate synthase small subunit [Bacillus sp. FJAT-42376]|uniref:carbamoyl phosphate synthase small subunit n=1 Tax=Bacillus sp. FJAT-42376 TaxID=2014076 RepID=UPI000F50BC21|nr:carbamoyl phosphate synthase small subunit [Bacillus sp. FJAT-42376]AZB42343.1 carbamoyl phosphate synthase small subunit [Bacillus sp. FJAT-42376]
MKGYIKLENGLTLAGEIGDETHPEAEGEAVFFTGMTGYQEVLSDPSYQNQILVFTYPLIGNYGINLKDFESKKPQISGAVFYECCEAFSHYEAVTSLKAYLKKWGIPFLHHVDTRFLVKNIRSSGTMNAKISAVPDAAVPPIKLPQHCGGKASVHGEGKQHTVLIDFGLKKSILTSLLDRGQRVTVLPYEKMADVFEMKPSGVVLSNGPGDPKQLERYLPVIKEIAAAFPVLGICLGHQLLALAHGMDTEKLPFGHRGANHPVVDRTTGKVFMTSQNHSYVVKQKPGEQELSVRFENVNDGSVEGLFDPIHSILSVQFHPEANPGPRESEWIFDEYTAMMNQTGRVADYA